MFLPRRTPLFFGQTTWRAMGPFYRPFLFHVFLFDAVPVQYGADHSAHMLGYACHGLVSAEPGKADRRQGSDCSLDLWTAGYVVHPGSGRLDVISIFLFVITSAGSTSRVSSANRFVGLGLGLYLDILPFLLCYSHRSAFNPTTWAFYGVSIDRPESVLSRPSPKVYASGDCCSRRHFFPGSSNRTPWVHQMDYCCVAVGCNLFFSDLRWVCAI